MKNATQPTAAALIEKVAKVNGVDYILAFLSTELEAQGASEILFSERDGMFSDPCLRSEFIETYNERIQSDRSVATFDDIVNLPCVVKHLEQLGFKLDIHQKGGFTVSLY